MKTEMDNDKIPPYTFELIKDVLRLLNVKPSNANATIALDAILRLRL